MDEIPNEMYEVHTILKSYVAIHDKIFKFSLRKIIPILGIFKPIDYCQHSRELDSLASELKQVVISASKRGGIPIVFQEYVTTLLKTIQFLRDICSKLYDKAEGDLKSYRMNQYKADVREYEELVNKYCLLGASLNKCVHK